MLEFLAGNSLIFFFIAFIIFIILAYKFVKFLFKAFLIGLVAAIFPIVGNLFLGMNIDITFYNVLWFAVTGVGLFVFYSFVRMGWRFLKLASSPVRWARRPIKHKKQKKEEKPKK